MVYVRPAGCQRFISPPSFISILMKDYEDFREIKGFEGLYMIGDRGTILSNRRGCWRIMSMTNKTGWYLTLRLKDKSGKVYTKRLHRLVYETFVGDIPDNYHIHHKDGDMQNNRVENLIAITEKEHHAIHAAENPNILGGMRHYNKYVRPDVILQYSLDGTLLGEYPNAKEASRQTGVCSRNILLVAHKTEYKQGKIRKQAGGYIWKIKDANLSA